MARAFHRAFFAFLPSAVDRASFRWFASRRLPASLRAPAERVRADTGLEFREVTVRSTDGLALGAWWVPAVGSSRVAVLVHGRGDTKASAYVVATASVYARAGFNVLMIDLRGWKWPERRFSTAGYQEARDVLGAISWLEERGYQAERVVLHGWSTGAAAVVRAAPGTGVAAVVEEGGHADLPLLLGSLVPGKDGPSTFLSYIAFVAARLLCVEFDPFELRPRRDAAQLHEEGVPLFIVHSRDDRVVPVEHARLLAAAHPAAVLWEIEDRGHTAAYTHPE
jgi:uncharacterized protein